LETMRGWGGAALPREPQGSLGLVRRMAEAANRAAASSGRTQEAARGALGRRWRCSGRRGTQARKGRGGGGWSAQAA
jgi:hypothetical protein